MLSELGYSIAGVAAGIGGVALMFRFLNAKIEKKQDTALCNNIVKNFSEGLHKGEEKFDKIMDKLGEIELATGKVEEQLKFLNGKT